MFRHAFTAKYKSIPKNNKKGLNYCYTVHIEDGLHYHNYSILYLRQVGETSFVGNVNYWWGSIMLTRARIPSVTGALAFEKCMCVPHINPQKRDKEKFMGEIRSQSLSMSILCMDVNAGTEQCSLASIFSDRNLLLQTLKRGIRLNLLFGIFFPCEVF
jgi:hypothetical protein